MRALIGFFAQLNEAEEIAHECGSLHAEAASSFACSWAENVVGNFFHSF